MRAPDRAALSLVTIPTTLSLPVVQTKHDVTIHPSYTVAYKTTTVSYTARSACQRHVPPTLQLAMR
jgi:hypothetical protein